MQMEMTVHIIGVAGKSDQLKAEIQELVEKTVQETGCLEFKVFQNTDDINHFILWEIFENQKALTLHLQKEYTKKYFNCGLVGETKVTKHHQI